MIVYNVKKLPQTAVMQLREPVCNVPWLQRLHVVTNAAQLVGSWSQPKHAETRVYGLCRQTNAVRRRQMHRTRAGSTIHALQPRLVVYELIPGERCK